MGKIYKTVKNVVLCRSGKQLYSKREVERQLDSIGGNPPKKLDKDFYVEYRPPKVVEEAKRLCDGIPLTKEHPCCFLDEFNSKEYAEGFVGDSFDITVLDNNEIGIKGQVYFYTADIYDYYTNNKEVSLGYKAEKHWVDNADELGYDIVLDSITEVNHLALTKAGRGGETVAILDSKGDKKMPEDEKKVEDACECKEETEKVEDGCVKEKDGACAEVKEEQEGAKKYEEMHEKTGDPKFKEMANDEKKHAEMMKEECKKETKDSAEETLKVFAKEVTDSILEMLPEFKKQIVDSVKKELLESNASKTEVGVRVADSKEEIVSKYTIDDLNSFIGG